ncbi:MULTISPECIES: response regulator transcription factor [Thermomonospora]|nr:MULTISPECIES: response regulator transcription factor [Thermomonospora]
MSTSPSGADAPEREAPMKVLVYSDDAATREQVRLAIGRRPAADLPPVEFVEIATQPAVVARLDAGDIDVAVVDGEAQPAGGLGVCRQAKDEVYDCPPFVAIIARRDDGWLATWSRADAVVSQPLDPMALAQAVADQLRRRRASRLPVR